MATGDAAKARAKAKAEKAEYERWLELAEGRSTQLISVVKALHGELDKIAKKWPTMEVSDLLLQRTNKVIRESHSLMDREDDDFLQEITEFIPAGDNPESRDVLLVLAELNAALSRFESAHRKEWRGY